MIDPCCEAPWLSRSPKGSPVGRSTAAGERIRPHPIARTTPAVAEIVKRRPADRLMGARRTVLPIAKGRFPNTIGRSAQVRRGTRIEVSAPHAVACRAVPIAEIIEVCLANRLSRSAELIEVVEGGIADVGARARLR